MRKYFEISMLLLFISVISGCDYRLQGMQVDKDYRVDIEAPEIYTAHGERILTTEPRFEYRIGIKDKLQVDVERHEEFSGLFTVNSDGKIVLPLVRKTIFVNGKTVKEVEAEIGWLLRQYVKQEPMVWVTVEEVLSKQYLVLGEAGMGTGKYQMPAEEVRLSDALLDAGVQNSKDADMRQVHVIRPDRLHPTYVVIDGEQVLMGRTRNNIVIQSGDIVYVPRKFSKKVDEVVGYILKRSGQVISLDADFQYLEDLLPHRSLGAGSIGGVTPGGN